MRRLRVALAQINTAVGDLAGNAERILHAVSEARGRDADIVALPELSITGYPPEDLVLYPQFLIDNQEAAREIARQIRGIAAVIGFVGSSVNGEPPLYNSAGLVWDGEIVHRYDKIHLPNYGVFDEARYFTRGGACPVFDLAGVQTGINVCEDVWRPVGPSEVQCAAGAEVLININASPYEKGKVHTRRTLITDLARRNRAYAAYVNLVGGQDELVFDGGSLIASPEGEVIALGAQFEEDLLIVDLDMSAVERARRETSSAPASRRDLAAIGDAVHLPVDMPPESGGKAAIEAPSVQPLEEDAEVYGALVLGTRDYVRKTGFRKVAVALSGGIDSALTATVAVDALGKEEVTGVAMPSRHSSEGSLLDARELAERLGIPLWTVPIEPAHQAFEEMLRAYFAGTGPNTAEENVQARIRGNVMMTISNKFGWLVLTTGNKSEMATGYATLYGDMAGGYAVIKDVPKTLVYRLCEHRNRTGPGRPIPRAIIDKPPSAELRPDQLDQDSLPPYPVLDRILESYIEERAPAARIIAREREQPAPNADEETVLRVIRLVDRNEYKRRQSPPGVKITGLAFGRDRRLPIAGRYTRSARASDFLA